MLRKDQVETKLDLLQQEVERLKSSLVVPMDPGDVGTPIQVVVNALQSIENQIDAIINLIQLED
jgi:hypothetical protein|tara:strand:- start:388 stop:579 length:192 start_codon:yes stop_codon:yes gene_type:complete